MSRITISLKDQEKIALRLLAEKQARDPRVQAALIIRQELQRIGLLQLDPVSECVLAIDVEDPKKRDANAGD